MITLREPFEGSVATLGVQYEDAGRIYGYSKYLIREGNAIFNSLTSEVILLEDEKKDRNELIRRWFLVPDGFDVMTASDMIRQRIIAKQKGPGSNRKTSYVIFTTTACNASCSYCFEKGCDILTMSDSVAEDVGKYIIETHAPKVRIKWFGGEPLVNKRPIDIISSKLTDKVDFRSSMSTNGDLLDECTDEDFKRWRLKSVQFTLDDVENGYDRIKGLKVGAYSRLKETVSRLGNLGITVQIRIHYNPDIGPEPCFKIIEDFKDFKNVRMYGRILYDKATINDYKVLLSIEDEILKTGKGNLIIPKRASGNNCMGDNPQVACITPEGKLSLCEHYAYGEYMYGSIYTQNVDWNLRNNWTIKAKYQDSKCKLCPLYPICRKIVMCPAEGKCSDGYQYYQIETIKRALRKKVEEINGRDSNTNN